MEKEPRMTKVYLASPYTHCLEAIREERFKAACITAGALIQAGFCVFSPIAHSHSIAENYSLPIDFDYWTKHDRLWMLWADFILVLQLDDWEKSYGIKEELSYAKAIGKPVLHITPAPSLCLSTDSNIE